MKSKKINWVNKTVLISGSEGMIGKELSEQLIRLGANVLRFDKKFQKEQDVRERRIVDYVYKIYKPEIVFHLFGIKGNPKKTKERPVDFIMPMIQGDSNMIELANKYKVKRFLYTSSIAVENPETDYYPAWAKKTGETLIEAMRIQYPEGTKYVVVRPSNVYGRFDNFERENNMVITKLINEAIKNKKIILDKKGAEQHRDFINAKDVARGMIKAMETDWEKPLNLCSGVAWTIKNIAEGIATHLDIPIEYTELNLTLGPDKKLMTINWDFTPEVSIWEGLEETIEYVINRRT